MTTLPRSIFVVHVVLLVLVVVATWRSVTVQPAVQPAGRGSTSALPSETTAPPPPPFSLVGKLVVAGVLLAMLIVVGIAFVTYTGTNRSEARGSARHYGNDIPELVKIRRAREAWERGDIALGDSYFQSSMNARH